MQKEVEMEEMHKSNICARVWLAIALGVMTNHVAELTAYIAI